MTRWAIRMGSAGLFACGVMSVILAAQTQRPPAFRGGAVLVTVDAYPQRDGRTVEGLTATDFEIFEDGTPQKVENFEFVRIEPSLSASERRDPNTQAESLELAADPHNRVFVVFLDALHVGAAGSHNIRRPLVDTLNRIVAPNDLFGVMTQNIQPRHLVLGRRLLSVEEQLTRFWPWGERHRITFDPTDPGEVFLKGCFEVRPVGGGFVDWKVLDDGVERYLYEILIDRRREDRTLTTLEDLVTHLSSLREARTVLMLISDGWLLYQPDTALANESARWTQPVPGLTITSSGRLGVVDKLDASGDRTGCNGELMRLAKMDNGRRMRDFLVRSNRGNISVYPVTSAGIGVFDEPISARAQPANINVVDRQFTRMTKRIDGLRTLAENTDGLAIVDTNDLSAGMKRIIDDVSAYYLLGYYSTNTRHDGRYRRIAVRVKPPGLSTKARRGYFALAETPSRTSSKVPPPRAATTAATSAVEGAFASLSRLRPSTQVFIHGVAVEKELQLAVELAAAQIADEKWAQGADVEVIVTSAAGDPAGKGQGRLELPGRGVLVRVPLDTAGPGSVWRVTAKVSAGSNVLDDRTEVRVVRGRLTGEPLLFRGTPAATSPLRPVADFQFRRTERIHVEWPTLAAVDRREARLLGRNGRPLPVPVNVTERDVMGRPGIAADLNLAPLSAGDYVIELTVGNGTETEVKVVAIRVVS